MKFCMPSAVTAFGVDDVDDADDDGGEELAVVGVSAWEPGSSPEPRIQATTTTTTPTTASTSSGIAALCRRRGRDGTGTGATGAVITWVELWSTVAAAGAPTGTARGRGAGSGADGPPARKPHTSDIDQRSSLSWAIVASSIGASQPAAGPSRGGSSCTIR